MLKTSKITFIFCKTLDNRPRKWKMFCKNKQNRKEELKDTNCTTCQKGVLLSTYHSVTQVALIPLLYLSFWHRKWGIKMTKPFHAAASELHEVDWFSFIYFTLLHYHCVALQSKRKSALKWEKNPDCGRRNYYMHYNVIVLGHRSFSCLVQFDHPRVF